MAFQIGEILFGLKSSGSQQTTGFIDVCPDQEYLVQRLLPIYSKVQLGSLPHRR